MASHSREQTGGSENKEDCEAKIVKKKKWRGEDLKVWWAGGLGVWGLGGKDRDIVTLRIFATAPLAAELTWVRTRDRGDEEKEIKEG